MRLIPHRAHPAVCAHDLPPNTTADTNTAPDTTPDTAAPSTGMPPVEGVPETIRSAGSGLLAASTASVLAVAVLALLILFPAPGASATDLSAVVNVWAAPPTSINQVLGNLRGFIVGISAGTATLFLSIGAVRYMWANGDPGEIEKAKRAFHGAAIGYGVAVLAPLGVAVLQGIVGTG